MTTPPVGMIAIDKPAGLTSHDVVARVRKALGTRRVGHAGTLDPLATGLLPVLVGPATRLARFLHGWPKSYVGVIRLGAESATGDLEGAPEPAGTAPDPAPEVLAAAVARLTGPQLQEPPAFSAKKVGGIRAHRLARMGAAPALAPVPVIVHRLRVTRRGPGRLAFAARVSSGTYLRSLARDLGRLVGSGGYLESLRRTGIGPLRVAGAVSLDGPREEVDARIARGLVALESVPLPLPTVRMTAGDAAEFRAGRRVTLGSPAPVAQADAVRAVAATGELAGIAELAADGTLQPRVVFPDPQPSD